jgi:hypothetical protein
MLEVVRRRPILFAVLCAVAFAIIAFLALVAFGLLLLSQGSRNSIPPIPSPDGTVLICPYVVGTSPEVLFELRDSRNRRLFSDSTGASDRLRWEFRWEDADTFVLESSDIGDVRWRRDAKGVWANAALNTKEVESTDTTLPGVAESPVAR